MRIGFDVSQTGTHKAGCGYWADGLIRQLAQIDDRNEYVLYPTFGDNYWDESWASETTTIDRPNFAVGLGHHSLEQAQQFWSEPRPNLDLELGSPDIVHTNNFFYPSGLSDARVVYTLYDLCFLEYPDWTTEQNRIACFDGVFNAAIHASGILSISNYTRDHFLDAFPHYPADKVVVAQPGSRFEGRSPANKPKAASRLERLGYWLSVGTIEPRKNYDGLLSAYARHKEALGTVRPLAIAGGKGWLMESLERSVAQMGLAGDVIVLGYVDEECLQWLYENCFAFAYLSHFEGFGLPVLEAMSLGAPVVASKQTSIPEIVGDAGLLVDPSNLDEIANALAALETGRVDRNELATKACRRAARFSWRNTAESALELYAEVAGRSKSD